MIFLALALGFFGIAVLFVRACERILAAPRGAVVSVENVSASCSPSHSSHTSSTRCSLPSGSDERLQLAPAGRARRCGRRDGPAARRVPRTGPRRRERPWRPPLRAARAGRLPRRGRRPRPRAALERVRAVAAGLQRRVGRRVSSCSSASQGALLLNPTDVDGVPAALAFNTASSFVTNTNWQNYGGESTMSHLTQMAGLTVQNFVSAAVGIAVAVALVRGLVRRRSSTIGNFWVDLTRITVRVLLPFSTVIALLLASQGVVQSLRGPAEAQTLEGATQSIYRAPVASQEAIKELGTNGGGIANANSAHPFENPTAFTNFVEIWALLAIPFALAFAFGRLVGDRRQGWALFAAMFVLWGASAGPRDRLRARREPAHRRELAEHGGQGNPLRRRRLRPLRRLDDGDVDRCGQRGPRQLHAARRSGPAREHDAGRGLAGRRRRRALRDPHLRAALRLHRRPRWSGGRPSTWARRSRRPR